MRNTVNLSRWILLGVVAFGLMVSVADAQSRSRRSASDAPFTTGSSGEIIKFINDKAVSASEVEFGIGKWCIHKSTHDRSMFFIGQ